MKKAAFVLILAAVLALLCGCGAIIVEDPEPVLIGRDCRVQMFT